MQQLDDNLWRLSFPLKLLGLNMQRNVTVIRLASNDLVIHSTAPFSSQDVDRIASLGSPRWLLDAMLDHDTFVKQGRDAFPGLTYLGPEGIAQREGILVTTLIPPPEVWGDELQVIRIEGAPSFDEHVFFHSPSRTLIVCDLLLHFPHPSSTLHAAMARLATVGKASLGVSRRLRWAVKDKTQLAQSLRALLQWDFDRIIVGHGDPVTSDGKPQAEAAFRRAGLL